MRNDLKAFNLTDKIALDRIDWKHKIHIDGPITWE